MLRDVKVLRGFCCLLFAAPFWAGLLHSQDNSSAKSAAPQDNSIQAGETYSENMPNWAKVVNVYLRNSEIKSVVGIERQN
jgi:hypothetical protein